MMIISKIVKERKYPNTDITELELTNGVKVLLQPTKFKEKEFNFSIFSINVSNCYLLKFHKLYYN